MAARLIRIKTSTNVISGYNNAGTNGTVGAKVANCVDSAGATTGISFYVNTAFTGATGSSGTWATADYHSLTESYWEWAWYSGTNGLAVMQLRGFPAGKSVTIGLTGWSLNATRHTDFFVNGVALSRYTNKSALPPNAPVTIVATADASGYITITGNKTDSFWYVNGLTASYEDNPLIDSIDQLESTSLSTAVTSDAAYAANSVDITSDTITKTVSATDIGSGSFTFTPPAWVDGATSLKYDVSNTVIATDGTTSTQSTTETLTLPSPLAAVVLTSVSANSLDKIGSFSPAWKIGTQVVYDQAVGTVYADGTFDDLVWDGAYWVSSGFTGTTQIWDRDPDDKIARVSNVTLNDGGGTDTTPSPFTFTDVTSASAATVYESNVITVTGVDAGLDIPVTIAGSGGTNHQYAVSTDGGSTYGSWTSSDTDVQLDYKIKVRLTSNATTSHGGGETASATLTVGGVSDTFTVTNAGVNTNPVVNSVLITELSGQIDASDGEGDTLTYTLTADGIYGSAVVNSSSGAFTYTPDVSFTGNDSFVVTITDGYGGNTVVTVSIVDTLSGGYSIRLGVGYGIGIGF